MAIRNLRRLRLLCGLTQFELSAGSNVSIHRIAQAEQDRIELSEIEEALIVAQLQKHWVWMSSLDPERTQGLAADLSILTGERLNDQELDMQVFAVMPAGTA
jgi:transcriptional regulator with XRE-family HTH domain